MSAEPNIVAIEIDDESLELLAVYDARGVLPSKLMQIFGATAAELEICRDYEAYKTAYAIELNRLEARARDLDDTIDAIELKAAADLNELLEAGAVLDPRALLHITSTANKMGRRAVSQASSGLERQRVDERDAALDGQKQVVIKLRSTFLDKVNVDGGHTKLVERETQIIETAPKKISDDMSVGQVRRHLSEDLNIDLSSLKVGTKGGSGTVDVIDTVVDVKVKDVDIDELEEFNNMLNKAY